MFSLCVGWTSIIFVPSYTTFRWKRVRKVQLVSFPIQIGTCFIKSSCCSLLCLFVFRRHFFFCVYCELSFVGMKMKATEMST